MHVLVSPRGSVSIMPTVALAMSGEMKTFNCAAEGGPDNIFEWMFRGSVVFNEPVYTVAADQSTFGMYICRVSNGAGSDSDNLTLFCMLLWMYVYVCVCVHVRACACACVYESPLLLLTL